MPFSQESRSLLSEQFAEIYQSTQDEYRNLLSDLRDQNVDINGFAERVKRLSDRLMKLKRIHVQLVHERDELRRDAGELRIEAGDAAHQQRSVPRETGDGESVST